MSSFEPPPSDEDVDGLGIKALRELIVSAGLSHADCVEKSDLRARAKLATAKLRDAPASSAAGGGAAAAGAAAGAAGAAAGGGALVEEELTLGPYSCVARLPAPGAAPPELVVVLLHGLGATKHDLVPLFDALAARPPLAGRRLALVCPGAPARAGGAMWWDLNLGQWMGAWMQGEAALAPLLRTKFAGVDDARAGVRLSLIHI